VFQVQFTDDLEGVFVATVNGYAVQQIDLEFPKENPQTRT